MFGSFSLFSSLCYVVRFNASFRFILTKSTFSLIGLSLGFFYCFRTKKTFSACLQLITLMLAYFTQNNVIVCLQLN